MWKIATKLTATQELSDLCALMQQTKHTKQHVLDSAAPTVQNEKHCCNLGFFCSCCFLVEM